MVSQESLEIARLRFLADAAVLRSICNPDAIGGLNSVIGDRTRRRGRDCYRLCNGFKWLAGVATYSLLEGIIDTPELLGLDWDQRAWTWWRDNRYEGSSTLPSAFTNPSSDLAGVGGRLFSILSLLRTSGDSWERMVEALGHALSISETLWTIALDCEVSPIRDCPGDFTVQEAVQLRALERLLDYLKYERAKMPSAYEFIWSNNASANEVPQEEDVFGDDVLDELDTELSPLPDMPFSSSVPVEWATGVIAGTCIAIQQLRSAGDKEFDPGEAFRKFTNGDGTVIGLLEDLVKAPFQDQYVEFPSQHFGLTGPRHLTSYDLTKLQGPVSRVSDPERLAALLGVENKLVASNGPLDHEQFATVISGLASLNDSPDSIKVVRVSHSQSDDDLNWFSLAVRVPRIGPMSNASLWWIFHKIYATGTLEPDCIIAERRVNDTLDAFKEPIDLEELSEVSANDLLALSSSPAWKFLHAHSKRIQEVNSDLRGAIPELVSALLLSHWGYQHIKANFKPSALGGREIDAGGILLSEDGCDCFVMEVKGSAETDEDLENQIIRFKAKLDDLREQLPQLSIDMGFAGTIKTVSGLFVSMSDLTHYERGSYGVELWDFQRFQEALRAAGVSEFYRNLLKKTSLTIVMRDFGGLPDMSLFEDDLPDMENLSIEDLPYDE